MSRKKTILDNHKVASIIEGSPFKKVYMKQADKDELLNRARAEGREQRTWEAFWRMLLTTAAEGAERAGALKGVPR